MNNSNIPNKPNKSNRCVIDTNVMITANKAVKIYGDDDDIKNYPDLIINCIKRLQKITKNHTYVVFDEDEEIFNEYSNYLDFSGQPGVGDKFFKWFHDNRYKYADTKVKLHKTDTGYIEFPIEMEVSNVDPSDKKFFAVSNGHPHKPNILQAVDAKWWNWFEAAKKCGIHIDFIDKQYMLDHNNT